MMCTIFHICCRHSVAGATADARHQQEDGRGAEGYLRLLGEGATAPRRAQRLAFISQYNLYTCN